MASTVKEFSIFPLEDDMRLSSLNQSSSSDRSLPPITSWKTPSFIFNRPWSQRADEEGIFTAQFLLENADKIKSASAKRDVLQSALDTELGVENSPKIEVTFFRNWGDTYRGVVMLAKPKHRSEVQSIVKYAALNKIKMRGGGGYHTFSKFQPDDENLLINTSELELPDPTHPCYRIDKNSMTITLSPGVNNAEILKPMIQEDVCFRSSVIIPTTTFGGMLSGGCHGVGIDQKPMSDWMTSMKVVNYKGEVQTIPDKSLSPDEKQKVLRAARVNLGTFGIIVEMTVKISPMEKVRVDNYFDITLGDVYGSADALSSYLKKYWSLHILWIPFSGLNLIHAAAQPFLPSLIDWKPDKDFVYLRGINKAGDHEEAKPPPDFIHHAFDALSQGAMGLQGRLMSKMPETTPLMLTIAFQALKQKKDFYSEVVQMPWGIFFRDGLDFCRAYDMEFDFPLDIDTPEKVIQAIKVLKDLTWEYAHGGHMDVSDNRYPLTMFCEVRFIANSDSYLCPSSLFQPTRYSACVEVQSTYATQDYKGFFLKLEKAWMDLGGIPHWHKQWYISPESNIIPYMQEKYGDNIDKFLAVRKSLGVDNEDDLFMNEMLMKVLIDR